MKKITSIILTLALSLSLTGVFADVNYGSELQNQPQKEYTQKFTDVPKTYWAFNYISEMVSRGVLTGYPDGKFRPDDAVTREEFAKIMCLAAGLTPDKPVFSTLEDIKVDDWSAPYIFGASIYLTCYKGTNDKYYFRPTSPETREDIAVSLVKLKGYDTSVVDVGAIKVMFNDFNSISESLQKYIAVAVDKGLVSGYEDYTFRAQDTVSRAEAATLLWRAYQYGNGDKVVLPDTNTVIPSSTPTATPISTLTPEPVVIIIPEKTTPTPAPKPEYVWSGEMFLNKCEYDQIVWMKGDNLAIINNNDDIIVVYDKNGNKSTIIELSSLIDNYEYRRSYGKAVIGYDKSKDELFVVFPGRSNAGTDSPETPAYIVNLTTGETVNTGKDSLYDIQKFIIINGNMYVSAHSNYMGPFNMKIIKGELFAIDKIPDANSDQANSAVYKMKDSKTFIQFKGETEIEESIYCQDEVYIDAQLVEFSTDGKTIYIAAGKTIRKMVRR